MFDLATEYLLVAIAVRANHEPAGDPPYLPFEVDREPSAIRAFMLAQAARIEEVHA